MDTRLDSDDVQLTELLLDVGGALEIGDRAGDLPLDVSDGLAVRLDYLSRGLGHVDPS